MKNRENMKHFFSRGRLKILTAVCGSVILMYFWSAPVSRFFATLYTVFIDFRFSVDNYQEFRIFLWTNLNTPPSVYAIDDYSGFLNSTFDPKNPVKILFHGFSDGADTLWTQKIKNSYLSVGPHNIISVDWQSSAESPWYNTAAKNARLVGKEAAKFLKYLVSHYNLNWEDIHVLGASLGGHAAGYIGRYTEGKIGRITGLDPSGPLFYSVPREDRLDTTDARFVDVIHSAGRWVGNDNIQGHVDFFPNGGRATQPGCRESLDLSCSHFLAWRLFAESITSTANNFANKFYGVKCESYDKFLAMECCRADASFYEMGENVSRELRGQIYLKTTESSPFALDLVNSTNCPYVIADGS